MGKFQIKETKTGFTFALKAKNGKIIGTSEVYTTKDAAKNGIESVKKNAPKAKIEDQTVKGFKTVSAPKFEIYIDNIGDMRFRLKAANSQNILASEGYKSKDAAKNGIESVVENAPGAVTEEE